MSIPRIANRDARKYVQVLRHFKGSNIFTEEAVASHGNSTLYIVYSYGEHYPMYIAEKDENNRVVWYVNEDKYSPSTQRHKSQCNPYLHTPGMCMPMTTEAMRRIALDGIAGLAVLGDAGMKEMA